MLDRAELLPIIAAAEAPRPGAAGEPPLLLTAQDLAAKLQVSLRSVRRLDLAGRLPAPVTIGRAVRWRANEIRDWCNAGCPKRNRWTWQPAEN